ncbi:glycoside hydrolase family 99-like domain-containing protein [Paracoccus sp. WLY502]|uniref:glycoside hydrolase family 99-like domain-containing protein n=1 Tax=Paracoccus yibinensis TaxID=3068891 RepID=UPI0027967B4B|nr:glycoside hydrolase family 99-like domain-containing protein [Paracoccus sp. WLY502]MDQ1902452.1 glycoside hydrolase family 99-like domain-containing protein [Paracoccus sp. WLY502]
MAKNFMQTSADHFNRALRFLRIFRLRSSERALVKAAKNNGFFDKEYYLGSYPHIHPLFKKFPLRHYAVYGEKDGYRPNPDFSPFAYLKYNADVRDAKISPLLHYSQVGRSENRIHKDLPEIEELSSSNALNICTTGKENANPYAVVVHIYYSELWSEFEELLKSVPFEFDLYVTLTYRGEISDNIKDLVQKAFPDAVVVQVENRGRDILPFVSLVNSGLLSSYKAVCKIHTKKSPHRTDGDNWRQHLVEGLLTPDRVEKRLARFVSDDTLSIWVADGQYYDDRKWWGSNFEITRQILRRVEIELDRENCGFPAGSMYWLKPDMIAIIKALQLGTDSFDTELGQIDGTVAHGFERAMGPLCKAFGNKIVQASELDMPQRQAGTPKMPGYVSAFYLPQFHPTPENDLWWGKGFTEWRNVVMAKSLFEGHVQPMLPLDLGFYDLRLPEVMGSQAQLAGQAGIDAFCVYHYWFSGRRILEQPLDNLLKRPDIDFPFYLCWANESWRRNWDGMSGTVLLEQRYDEGFETALADDCASYMRDKRYQRPDGSRPRFVIYRPGDLPDAAASVSRLRKAWRQNGVGEVEIGAVLFHLDYNTDQQEDFDFWIEMPPHGLVQGKDYLFGGPGGSLLDRRTNGNFSGLVYDYTRVVQTSVSDQYSRSLPANTIRGVMPSWDNTARRGNKAHIAYGANPASFNLWLRSLTEKALSRSYRGELFINAWNEWAEKAVLEPSMKYDDLYLKVLSRYCRSGS